MNKSQRIYLNTGNTGNDNQDKYIKIKLEQDVETLEFMSLSLGTADVYQNFNADYGILVGRVLANGGIGIPNARISIFIPLSDEDAQDKDIYSVYPYTTPRDKNNEGKRYNLLPRVAQKDPQTGIITPKQPFGSFPIKEEIVGNLPFLNAYKKYYKYTALTNSAGDYMIFGVPIGTQTIHLSCDITDIGEYSMTPAAMVTNLGYSPNLFTDNNSKIKPSNDLNDLPNIETQEITVDIKPFWGDTEIFEIGITRQDFRIRSVLKNTFTIFGTVFTDPDKNMWGDNPSNDNHRVCLLYKMNDVNRSNWENIGILNKRSGIVTEKIYYYPNNVSDDDIDNGDAVDQMLLLDNSEYSFYKKNGDFIFIINSNRKRIIIDEKGNKILVNESNENGLFTEFKGFIVLEIDGETLSLDWTSHGEHVELKSIRQKLKFPQHANYGNSFRYSSTYPYGPELDSNIWRQQYYTFSGGGIYSVAKFHGIVANNHCESAKNYRSNGFITCDRINDACHGSTVMNAGIIQTNDYGYTGNTDIGQMIGNSSISCSNGTICLFGANWLNMSIYLPQTGWVYNGYSYIYCWRTNTQFTHANKNDTYYVNPNTQQVAGNYFNTCSFARSDLNWTDIISVPKEDILAMNDINSKGFKSDNNGTTIITSNGSYTLQGTYRNGTCIPSDWIAATPGGGGRINGTCTSSSYDTETYFYKGVNQSNVINYLFCLGIV